MNLIKTGKFIAEKRKEKNITQNMLAEKLGITDRAISKWERGLCLPDAGLMIPLCETLEISVNELLNGEKISMEEKSQITDRNLVNLAGKLGHANKMLLRAEIIYTSLIVLFFTGVTFLSEKFISSESLKMGIMAVNVLLILICAGVGIYIETKTGFYECKKCGHKHVPKTSTVFWAPHMGTTRYMRCPECKKRTWHKKSIN